MKTKKEHKYFTIVQYEQEAAYLREMHKSGWKFTDITGLGTYHFVECEPEDVIYQLDYNQEGLKNKEEYVQMFEDCGWEYLMDFMGYSYFCKAAGEMQDEEGIFCDDESRLEMMNRVFRGRLIPLIVIFCCCLLPQLMNAGLFYENPLITGMLAAIVIIYAVMFAFFTYQYFSYKQRVKK